jgi:1,6-anhydro-N-acetylmuramate kinase
MDGLDCALVEVAGRGLSMRARFVRGASAGLGALSPRLRAIAEQDPITAGGLAGMMREFSLLHAEAVRGMLAGDGCDLVCVHGQTVFHQPPLSWQMFQPAPLVAALRVPVVYDLRQADLAAGGQGAPITPIADWVLFRGAEARTIVNLGGFCNVTLLPGADGTVEAIAARDVCACNQLLDAIARRRLGTAYDAGGAAAERGKVDTRVVEDLASTLCGQTHAARSLGTGDELQRVVARFNAVEAGTLARSACEAIAEVVLGARGGAAPVLAGGGVRNRALVGAFVSRDARTTLSEHTGIPCEYREAACFAVLGALCQDRMPITLPQVTGLPKGVAAPVAGVWAFP